MSLGQNSLYTLPVIIFAAIVGWPSDNAKNDAPAAQEFAAMFDGVLPKTLPDGTYIHSPKAEGDVLIFAITPSSDVMDVYSSAEIERLNVNVACSSGDGLKGFFGRGGKLRVDIHNPEGGVHNGVTRSSC